ncbi:MAG: hypothetical protein HZY78_12115 [Burkholderiaceae bacterium]|nr:MAG: hypothetical protein HZY78_12115 [Burkholderiaceae bacterium]
MNNVCQLQSSMNPEREKCFDAYEEVIIQALSDAFRQVGKQGVVAFFSGFKDAVDADLMAA